MVLPSAGAWLYFVTFPEASFLPLLYAASKLVQFSFPLAWILLVLRQRPKGLVPLARVSARDLGAGAVSGGAIAVLLAGVYLAVIKDSGLALVASPRIASRLEVIGAARPAAFLALTLFLAIAHSFLEEYYWRWFVFGRLRRHGGITFSVILSSLAFAAHHVIVLHSFIGPGRFLWVTVILSFSVAVGGGLWAWLYARSGSLVGPWLSHALVDLAVMTIGYDLSRGLV